MPKSIQDPRFGQALQRAFGLQGRVDPALDEIIVPVVTVGELSRNAPPPVSLSAGASAFEGAVAGERATFRFEVPGNVLARIDRVSVRGASAAGVRVRTVNVGGPQANTQTSYSADGRVTDQGINPAGILTSGTTPSGILLSQTTFNWWSPVDGSLRDFTGLVVGSGRAGQFGFLEFQYNLLNVDVFFSLEWTEYRIV